MIYPLDYIYGSPGVYVARITPSVRNFHFQRNNLKHITDTKPVGEECGVRTFKLQEGPIYEASGGQLGRGFLRVAGDEIIPMTGRQVQATFHDLVLRPAKEGGGV